MSNPQPEPPVDGSQETAPTKARDDDVPRVDFDVHTGEDLGEDDSEAPQED